MNYITILEYLGVFAFAVSGAIVAIEEEFDWFGIYILATITAMGGGVLRDMVTDVGVPIFFTSYGSIALIILGATFAIILKGQVKYTMLFTIIDTLGLGAFFVSAGMKAIEREYNFVLFLFAASITGVGGGVLRDIITKRKPQIFRHDIYCVAGMIGAIVLWMAYPYMGSGYSQFIAIVTIISVRMICYIKKVNLPVVDREVVDAFANTKKDLHTT